MMQTTDCLMVIITTVYTIATILICIANIRSANAIREQIAESVRQFNEENCAFVTVNFEIIRGGLAVLHIQNHGKRIANNVRIIVALAFINNILDDGSKGCFEKLYDATFTLGIGQSWYISMGSHIHLQKLSEEILEIDISYVDNISEHNEVITIDLKQYFWALLYDSPETDMSQEIKNIAQGIKSINSTLKKMKLESDLHNLQKGNCMSDQLVE